MKPITACRWLDNKGFMMGPPAEPAPQAELLDQFSTPCWCIKTHDGFGPDGDVVELRTCRRGRGCFEPEVEI